MREQGFDRADRIFVKTATGEFIAEVTVGRHGVGIAGLSPSLEHRTGVELNPTGADVANGTVRQPQFDPAAIAGLARGAEGVTGRRFGQDSRLARSLAVDAAGPLDHVDAPQGLETRAF